MKHTFPFLLAALLLLAITSCSKSDDERGASTAVATSLRSGTWRVTTYSDNGADETTDFNSFTFIFTNSGTVTATNSILTANGTWSTGIDDSKHKLNLNFSSPAFFSEISEDWEIVSQSSTQVSLRHVSGGSGEIDLLVFQKN
ncbi:MAG: hypothetical protein EOO13_03460 [Chitinophagaceae bacterium]|nr:MAG: hypothetical protein EOO13_03460 [Chitinophagaceae bacterium]